MNSWWNFLSFDRSHYIFLKRDQIFNFIATVTFCNGGLEIKNFISFQKHIVRPIKWKEILSGIQICYLKRSSNNPKNSDFKIREKTINFGFFFKRRHKKDFFEAGFLFRRSILSVNKRKIQSNTENHLAVVWTDGGHWYHSSLHTLFPYSDLIRLECLRYWSAEKCSVVCGEHLSLFGKFFLKQTFREMPSIIKNKNRSGGGIHTTESLPCFKNNF